MKPAALSLAVVACFLGAGCGGGSGRGAVSLTPPRPVDQVDALELWATPPAAINWDEVPGPDGVQVRLYLYQLGQPQPVMVDGDVEFQMYAGRLKQDSRPDTEPFKVWRLSSDDLAVRRVRSMVGWGYVTRLGWGGQAPDATLVTVRAAYRPREGRPVFSAPVSIALPARSPSGPRRSLLGGPAAAEALERRLAADRPLSFRHRVLDADPPGAQHTILLLADLNGDGRVDVITGCKRGPHNLAWYENPSWERHAIAKAPGLEAGAVLLDVNRDGRVDVLAGRHAGSAELLWFEHPPDPVQPWPSHVIDDRFETCPGLAVGDVDGDGEPEVVVLSRTDGTVVYYDLPADPSVEPWPVRSRHEVASGAEAAEGLAVADVDGDGPCEIIAGPAVYGRSSEGEGWRAKPYAPGIEVTEIAAADLDGDTRPEIVACEGASSAGRLLWFKGPTWTPHPLREDLFHPRSLALADFDADRRPDILVAEMGLGRNEAPRLFIYRNLGGGRFRETLVSQGVPTHHARAADLTGDGRPDIVGKPYDPERHLDLWVNQAD